MYKKPWWKNFVDSYVLGKFVKKWRELNNIPEYVLPLANDDESLSSGVIGINVFQGGGRELIGELGRQPDWNWTAALQDGIRHRSIIVVVIISNLKKEPEMLSKIAKNRIELK